MTEKIVRDAEGRAWLQREVDGVRRSSYLGRQSEASLEGLSAHKGLPLYEVGKTGRWQRWSAGGQKEPQAPRVP